MAKSDRVERVLAVLAGRKPDRVPVSFWHHFASDQHHGAAAVRAHLEHLRTYELDFLKVMNDNGYPSPGEIRNIKDLQTLRQGDGDEPEFARQWELIAALRAELAGEVLITTTVFNAWATLRGLVRPRKNHSPPNLQAGRDEASARIARFIAEDRSAVQRSLAILGRSLARFARGCLEAGADGIFLSVRDDWVDTAETGIGTYRDLVRPTDLAILEAASAGRFNMLHVCGRAVDFTAFAAYPVHALNWADRAAGPAVGAVSAWVRPAICGGVDNLGALVSGSPEDCAAQVRDALMQAGDRPIMIAPGCTFDPRQVPKANLSAVCAAARAARGAARSSCVDGECGGRP